MSLETYQWLLAFHVLGFMAWCATLTSAMHTMRFHTRAGEAAHDAFVRLERQTGIAMDASAMVAIAFGVTLLLGDFEIYMQHGYMHIKLTAVAALIGMHVAARIKMKRLRAGTITPFKPWMISVAYSLIVVIVLAVVAGPVVFGN